VASIVHAVLLRPGIFSVLSRLFPEPDMPKSDLIKKGLVVHVTNMKYKTMMVERPLYVLGVAASARVFCPLS
jgi:hypothetical protein